MRNDLLDAKASIDWAVANLPAFETRLGDWVVANVTVTVKELPADVPNNIIVAMEKAGLPLAFNVEAGAYINAIRSSLDMLAWAIGKREMVLHPDEVYFPVAQSAEDFRLGNYKGAKFVRQLSGTSRKIIEDCRPYKGGGTFLYSLHHFDIVRKHRRLLSTEVSPASFRFQGGPGFTPISTGWMRSAHNETILGIIAKDATHTEIEYSPHVTISDPGVMRPYPVILALKHFANLAKRIIERFDNP